MESIPKNVVQESRILIQNTLGITRERFSSTLETSQNTDNNPRKINKTIEIRQQDKGQHCAQIEISQLNSTTIDI